MAGSRELDERGMKRDRESASLPRLEDESGQEVENAVRTCQLYVAETPGSRFKRLLRDFSSSGDAGPDLDGLIGVRQGEGQTGTKITSPRG
jgi:hypothetical protein